jgi:hypothetical protein
VKKIDVLCDDLECNSLLVPVDFPKECLVGDDGDGDSLAIEDCVIENIDALEREGEAILVSQVRESEDLQDGMRYETLESAKAFLRDAPLDFPDWWVPPNKKEDSECELLAELLNEEDMLDERTRLACRACMFLPNEDIKLVKVQVVGPAGLLLKVEVDPCGERDEGTITEKEVSIKFPGAGSVREKMLELLSSVEDVTKEELDLNVCTVLFFMTCCLPL